MPVSDVAQPLVDLVQWLLRHYRAGISPEFGEIEDDLAGLAPGQQRALSCCRHRGAGGLVQ
jgi:hypothetical protein